VSHGLDAKAAFSTAGYPRYLVLGIVRFQAHDITQIAPADHLAGKDTNYRSSACKALFKESACPRPISSGIAGRRKNPPHHQQPTANLLSPVSSTSTPLQRRSCSAIAINSNVRFSVIPFAQGSCCPSLKVGTIANQLLLPVSPNGVRSYRTRIILPIFGHSGEFTSLILQSHPLLPHIPFVTFGTGGVRRSWA
jgi:hypothetical protein